MELVSLSLVVLIPPTNTSINNQNSITYTSRITVGMFTLDYTFLDVNTRRMDLEFLGYFLHVGDLYSHTHIYINIVINLNIWTRVQYCIHRIPQATCHVLHFNLRVLVLMCMSSAKNPISSTSLLY